MKQSEYETAAVRALRDHGGRMTLAELQALAVIPSVHIRETMRMLIAAHDVVLEGESTYALLSQTRLDERKPVSLPTAATSEQPAAPTPAPEPTRRRCVRCEELLTADHFPKRPGMVRAPRVCSSCCPADDTIGSPRDLARRKTPGAKPAAEIIASTTECLAKNFQGAMLLHFNPNVYRLLESMTKTGLWGTSIVQTAEMLVLDGVRRTIIAETPGAAGSGST